MIRNRVVALFVVLQLILSPVLARAADAKHSVLEQSTVNYSLVHNMSLTENFSGTRTKPQAIFSLGVGSQYHPVMASDARPSQLTGQEAGLWAESYAPYSEERVGSGTDWTLTLITVGGVALGILLLAMIINAHESGEGYDPDERHKVAALAKW